ncbi:MAG: hypothetical protein NVSMB55_28590 [Mycobacteriales bacterium]
MSLSGWSPAVQTASEACLLLDREARVVAASPAACVVLGADSASAVGAPLAELVTAVDFTSGAAPDPEPHRAVPPLRALATGGLARGLLRLRTGAQLATYDVVAVPLTDRSGVLAFFVTV